MFGFGVKSVSVEELAERLSADKPVLIDVREPGEFAGGHVPGAVNIPLGTLRNGIAKLDPHAETYVICHSGNRSRTGVSILKKAGFDCVYNVKGGTSAWRGRLAR